VRQALQILAICDGSNWIDPLLTSFFGVIVRIIDWFHASEQSQRLGPPQQADGPEHPRRILARNVGYFTKHRQHMRYPQYRAKGWPIGSGVTGVAQGTWSGQEQVKRNVQAERWRTVPKIGWVLVYTIQAEVGTMEQFADGKHLASYSLLVPLAEDSGEEDGSVPLGRHVGQAGRRTLKWAFIEAAHGAVRKSAFFRDVFDRRTNGGTRDKNRGYIAVARKLCCVGAACVRNGTDYSQMPPLRPGCRVGVAGGAAGSRYRYECGQ